MKQHERFRAIMRSPKLIWNVLFQGQYDFTFDLMPVHIRQMSMSKRLNLFKAGANFIHRSLKPWSWPLHLQIELTNYCNLKCPICPTGIGKMNRKPMAMDVSLFEQLMNEVGPHLLTMSLWAWGESLLHPKLMDMLRIARQHDIFTIFSTNGQKLNDERVRQAIIKYPPTHLIVAIDGLVDETNSKYRVGAKLERALSGVRRLAKIKQEKGLDLPLLHMRYIVMKHNEHEITHLKEFAIKNGFDFLTVRALSICDGIENKHRELVPNASKFQAYMYKNNERVQHNNFICYWPFWFPTVLVDGTVLGCDQDYNAQNPLGVFSKEVSFADIWFGQQAIRFRKKIRDQPDSINFCKNCPYQHHNADACSIQKMDLN
ncbi:MAG: radical SAM protein [Candidatus Parabeggiatoa sp.]|nr:radical SAM protein [Candidatus Parabeggiatoa sp.]